MNLKLYFSKRISIIFIVWCTLGVHVDIQFVNTYSEEHHNKAISAINETLPNNLLRKISNSSHAFVSLSLMSTVLSTKSMPLTEIKNNKRFGSSKNQSSSFQSLITDTKNHNLSLIIPSNALVTDLVDQFNHYHNIDIISCIRKCDSHMKLSDMCATYSFDNHTYALVRESNVRFHSLQHVYDSLIERTIVQRLNANCPIGQWCLGNLTKNNIRFTVDVLRRLGRSFCLLEKCNDRLHIHATVCSSITPESISIPTLRLLPMLCIIYNKQSIWNSTECTDKLVYVLHVLYAFWFQFETCYQKISAGSNGCTDECLTFNDLLQELENKCSRNDSFLTGIPTLAWYRSVNLEQICRQETLAIKSSFLSSVKNFISSNIVWYRFHQRPVYAALFLIIVICITIGFSLCLYFIPSNDFYSNTRNFDDGYEYTRLHDSTIELDANIENSSIDLVPNTIPNQSQLDLNDNRRCLRHQRLL